MIGIDRDPGPCLGGGCHFLPQSGPGQGVIKMARVEFQIYLLYISAYEMTFKVQKPTLKNWGDLLQQIQKSYFNIYMKIFFIFYMKNALLRKNKERAWLRRF